MLDFTCKHIVVKIAPCMGDSPSKQPKPQTSGNFNPWSKAASPPFVAAHGAGTLGTPRPPPPYPPPQSLGVEGTIWRLSMAFGPSLSKNICFLWHYNKNSTPPLNVNNASENVAKEVICSPTGICRGHKYDLRLNKRQKGPGGKEFWSRGKNIQGGKAEGLAKVCTNTWSFQYTLHSSTTLGGGASITTTECRWHSRHRSRWAVQRFWRCNHSCI